MAKILIIEDDEDHCRLVAQALRTENHTTEAAYDGKEGLHRMLSYSYDLIICDWMLPSMPGVEICKEYRKQGGNALVLMLTGKTSPEDIHKGLDAGADDYLGKPFYTRELLARVRALLRRAAKPQTEKVLRCANIEFDPATLSVKKSGVEVKLSKKEIGLLTVFLKNPERVFSLEQLRLLWTDSPDTSEDTVRAHIKTLRKKLHADNEPEIIVNIHGQGYRLNGKLITS
jgi:DNA-binding response OmpR family regulator